MQKKLALYLDDTRNPTENPPGYEWKIVRDYIEFTAFIINYFKENRKLPDLISFDHDLSPEHVDYYLDHQNQKIEDYSIFKDKTGMHAAQWLIAVCEKNNISLKGIKLCVHSHNPAGSSNIQNALNAFKSKQLGPGEGDCFLNQWPFEYDQKIIQKRQKEHEEKTNDRI